MEKGKRRSQPYGKTGTSQSQRINSTEQERLSEMRTIMLKVKEKLRETKLNDILRKKISDLETEKRETVGIFGRTGSGKSSLINVILGEKDLLPSGDISACTTVIIKVEANMENEKYEAEIEFIPLEDAKNVVLNLKKTALAKDDSDGEVSSGDDEDDDDDTNKSTATIELSGLYGENWEQICSQDDFINEKHFRKIPELFSSGKKTVSFKSAGELSKELKKYTKTFKKRRGEDKENFTPLVKCVTVRVPNSGILENVTLVDLPGSGDNNRTRDNKWKEVVGSCSTVWIVTEITRAASEKEAWEILKSVSSLIGNGGQCQRIHFICTKSDSIGISDNLSAAISQRNKDAKEEVKDKFSTQKKLKTLRNHLWDECFEVFTVSAKEFQQKQCLHPVDTEIPKLKEVLQSLNDRHSEILNYGRGACGILSLIQGARFAKVSKNEEAVCMELERNLDSGQKILLKSMNKSCEAFDRCLRTGVEKSLSSCDSDLTSFLNPKRSGRVFHRILHCVVKNRGACTRRNRENLNLNETLASWLKGSIDEEFSKTFPNLQSCEPFKGAIKSFTLQTGPLLKKYKDVDGMPLRLKYLSTEEKQMKVKLNEKIRDRKKKIYNSLVTAIEENMAPCYDKAKKCTGKGSLKKMKTIIQNHFEAQKNVIFEEAKEKMMLKLRKLMDDINKTVEEHMKEAIEHSLKTNFEVLPDVESELKKVTEHYNKLKEKQRTSPLRRPERAGPSNA